MLFDFRTRFLLLAFFAPATAARDGEHQILIDRGDSLSSKWVLTLGTEYPGASGALALSNDGQSLNVSFDLLDGGRYVGTTFQLPSALVNIPAGSTIAAAVRGATTFIRVRDSTGQDFASGFGTPAEITQNG